jgi:hypothetical protein
VGELLRTFNYPRNAFASTARESATKAHEVIARARGGTLLDKDEPFNDSKTFLGTVGRRDSGPIVTGVGDLYERLYFKDPTDAWRWLVTRAMWRYSFPNGTNSLANRAAQQLEVSFNFFDLMLRLTWAVSAEVDERSVLYFDELLPILDDDEAWGLSHHNLYAAILDGRSSSGFPAPASRRSLLGDLETAYKCGRDNMNTVFRKGFGQSGLFELVTVGPKIVGVKIAERVSESPVLWRRLRHVLDHPAPFDGTAEDADE